MSAFPSTYLFTASSVISNELDAFVYTPGASPPSAPSVDIPVTVIPESANPKAVASIVDMLTIPVPLPLNTRLSFDLDG